MVPGADWPSASGLTQVLVEFAQAMADEESMQRMLDHLVRRMAEVLPVTGAGVMLMGAGDDLHFVAASNDVVLRIEGLQNELHEGPCLEAFHSGAAVLMDDLSQDVRFPRFSQRAWHEGLRAVFTFPLRVREVSLGALDLYRDSPGGLQPDQLSAAQVLADVAAAYLANTSARSKQSAAIAQLNHRSLHDPLTELPNRVLLSELLEQAVARARRSNELIALLFLDLDGFKRVNDVHGHDTGDQLLISVSQRLRQVLRPGDALARLGGDEFVLLCEGLHVPEEADMVADRIGAVLRRPFQLGEHHVSISASIGVAFDRDSGDTAETMLRDADFAMYEAKREGGGRHRVVDAAARSAAAVHVDLGEDLRLAQHRRQLHLEYQPVIDIRDRTLRSVEALLRWTHPTQGPIQPQVIITGAERSGQIRPLGQWVLRQACLDLRRWNDAGHRIPTVAVNVSAAQLTAPGFVTSVRETLEDVAVTPEAVCLELTETVLLHDESRALSVMQQLRELGVRLALDDFGTGYSSLNYLRRFPFDTVKIDRSFTADVQQGATRTVVQAMIDLSHGLGHTVIVEGVETAQELDDMLTLGADHAQGFHLGRPRAATAGSPY
jgi:diguanylate cyclase (GGDEF)-like protein